MGINKISQKKKEKPQTKADGIFFSITYVSGDLTKEERLDYVNAVKCLMKLPAKTPQEVAPGAKSRVGTVSLFPPLV